MNIASSLQFYDEHSLLQSSTLVTPYTENDTLINSPKLNNERQENRVKHEPSSPESSSPSSNDTSPNRKDGIKRRSQVKNACVNCQKACKKCDEGRPCQRCIKLGITGTCQDSPRKERKKGFKRGPYRKKSVTTQHHIIPKRENTIKKPSSPLCESPVEEELMVHKKVKMEAPSTPPTSLAMDTIETDWQSNLSSASTYDQNNQPINNIKLQQQTFNTYYDSYPIINPSNNTFNHANLEEFKNHHNTRQYMSSDKNQYSNQTIPRPINNRVNDNYNLISVSHQNLNINQIEQVNYQYPRQQTFPQSQDVGSNNNYNAIQPRQERLPNSNMNTDNWDYNDSQQPYIAESRFYQYEPSYLPSFPKSEINTVITASSNNYHDYCNANHDKNQQRSFAMDASSPAIYDDRWMSAAPFSASVDTSYFHNSNIATTYYS